MATASIITNATVDTVANPTMNVAHKCGHKMRHIDAVKDAAYKRDTVNVAANANDRCNSEFGGHMNIHLQLQGHTFLNLFQRQLNFKQLTWEAGAVGFLVMGATMLVLSTRMPGGPPLNLPLY